MGPRTPPLLLFIATSLAAEFKNTEPDLGTLTVGQGWRIGNRSVTSLEKDGNAAGQNYFKHELVTLGITTLTLRAFRP